MSMGKLADTLGNVKHLASSPDLPATKLHVSCSLLLFASLYFFFFLQWPRFNKKVEGRTIPWSGNLENSQRWELGTGQAQPHVYLPVKDLASGAVHLKTSTSVCGEQSCCVCVHLHANSVCFKHVCQTGLFSRLWWTKSACLSVSNRIEFVWEVLIQLCRKLWALCRNCKRKALATSIRKDNRF